MLKPSPLCGGGLGGGPSKWSPTLAGRLGPRPPESSDLAFPVSLLRISYAHWHGMRYPGLNWRS